MEGVNKVILIGHLGRAAKRVQVKFPMLTFTIAINERRWSPGGWRDSTSWHTVIIKGKKKVEAVENMLLKGTPVYLEGRLINRSYTDKNGFKKYTTEVEVTGQLLIFPKRGQVDKALQDKKPDPSKNGDNGVDTHEGNAAPDLEDEETFEGGKPEEGGYDDDLPF